MPAETLAVNFAVGNFAPAETATIPRGRNGGTEDPQRGLMAGQGIGRIDDTLLVREAQRGNRAAFEELVRNYDQAVLRLPCT